MGKVDSLEWSATEISYENWKGLWVSIWWMWICKGNKGNINWYLVERWRYLSGWNILEGAMKLYCGIWRSELNWALSRKVLFVYILHTYINITIYVLQCAKWYHVTFKRSGQGHKAYWRMANNAAWRVLVWLHCLESKVNFINRKLNFINRKLPYFKMSLYDYTFWSYNLQAHFIQKEIFNRNIVLLHLFTIFCNSNILLLINLCTFSS